MPRRQGALNAHKQSDVLILSISYLLKRLRATRCSHIIREAKACLPESKRNLFKVAAPSSCDWLLALRCDAHLRRYLTGIATSGLSKPRERSEFPQNFNLVSERGFQKFRVWIQYTSTKLPIGVVILVFSLLFILNTINTKSFSTLGKTTLYLPQGWDFGFL